jgi:hypothetical protein
MSTVKPEANLATLLPLDKSRYVDHCREERQFAALLYHELLCVDQLRAFLGLIGVQDLPSNFDDVAVFFEFTPLRDRWAAYGEEHRKDRTERSARYRATIESLLQAPSGLLAQFQEVREFNAFFIDASDDASRSRLRVSADEIQMPSRWNDRCVNKWQQSYRDYCAKGPSTECGDPEVLAEAFANRIVRLKWAFNAKPDLVIQLSPRRAVCVEIKVASKEANYAVKTGGKSFTMKQTDVQREVLALAGFDDIQMVILSKKPTCVKQLDSPCPSPIPVGNPTLLAWCSVKEALRLVPRAKGLPFVADFWKSSVLGAGDACCSQTVS